MFQCLIHCSFSPRFEKKRKTMLCHRSLRKAVLRYTHHSQYTDSWAHNLILPKPGRKFGGNPSILPTAGKQNEALSFTAFKYKIIHSNPYNSTGTYSQKHKNIFKNRRDWQSMCMSRNIHSKAISSSPYNI